MSNYILVPTDLSSNSAAGIRFAIKLASQTKGRLLFYHSIELMKPVSWSDEKYKAYAKEEVELAENSLVKFVNKTYEKAGIAASRYECVVQQSADAKRSIVRYARKIGASYICMSTNGAGKVSKLLGTHASGVVSSSPVPVFVIPKSYRNTEKIKSILYSSDLNNLKPELSQVARFSKAINAKAALYHYDYQIEEKETKKKLSDVSKKFKTPGVKFVFKKLNIEKSLASQIIKDSQKQKASLVVLFTNQKKSWFDKLFLSNNSVDVAFASKVPLLVFPKK
jgi:nucleotide-binding universal stress UspA family protein